MKEGEKGRGGRREGRWERKEDSEPEEKQEGVKCGDIGTLYLYSSISAC